MASKLRKNMGTLNIFIWQSSIEHHEYYTWLALHARMQENESVTFVLGQLENDIRKAQGWNAVDLTKLNVIFLPSKKLWADGTKLINENADAIHVFLGFRGTKKGYNFFPLILYALTRKIKATVINEPYSIRPVGYFNDDHPMLAYISVWIRPILYRGMALFINLFSKSEKPCIFPISMIAKEQFRKSGFDAASMFPFGWFVPDLNRRPAPPKKDMALRVLYVGAMNQTKGADILISAVKLIRSQGYKVTLDLYGSGDPQKYADLGPWLCHHGLIPFEMVQPTMQKYDLLITPSRHDGWGVVVNEALLQGVPVIASSRVGAKVMIEASGAGLVFESENVNDLVEKIKMVMLNPVLLDEMKRKASQVGPRILPEKGAQYFLDVLKYYFYKIGARPSAIWCDEPYLDEPYEP
jgi:glycosyltransferase involved in cell wall biosynthesis